MTLIEGVGDEVIEFFIGVIIIVIGVAAWWSTRIADRPLIRTVLVFERRSHSTLQLISQTTAEEPQTEQQDQTTYVRELPPVQSAGTETEAEENKPPTAGSSVAVDRGSSAHGAGDSSSENPSRVEEEQNEIVETMDADASDLRRRRLEFFQNRPDPSIESEVDRNSSSNNVLNDQTQTAENDANSIEDNANTSRSESTETTETVIEEDDIRIKLKYINDDLKLVNGKLQEPLGDFKRRHFEPELSNNKLVRLIFNGQVLHRDDVTLQGCGLFNNCVVHCLVHPNKNTSNAAPNTNSGSSSSSGGSNSSDQNRTRLPQNTQNQGRDWDLGNLFFTIVSFVLGAAWYFRYEYAQLYTVTATVALVGLTGIFTVLLVGMYFPDPEPPIQHTRS